MTVLWCCTAETSSLSRTLFFLPPSIHSRLLPWRHLAYGPLTFLCICNCFAGSVPHRSLHADVILIVAEYSQSLECPAQPLKGHSHRAARPQRHFASESTCQVAFPSVPCRQPAQKAGNPRTQTLTPALFMRTYCVCT